MLNSKKTIYLLGGIIIVKEVIIKKSIKELINEQSHEEFLYKICTQFINLFPVSNVALFRYSSFGFLAEGVLSIRDEKYYPIQEMRDDIRSLPSIYSALRSNCTKFCEGTDLLFNHSLFKYKESINNTLTVPISSNNTVIGYFICIDLEPLVVTNSLLQNTLLYGKEIGKLMNSGIYQEKMILTRREFEVMQRIANGESTKEMTISMNISESTIKQYVKSSMTKLGAYNRTHAVAELFRRGYFS